MRRDRALAVSIAVLCLGLAARRVQAQTYQVLHDFSQGAHPAGGVDLLEDANGNVFLRGTTTAGGNGFGTFFSFFVLTSGFTEFPFDGSNGSTPLCRSVDLVEQPFGTAQLGGANGLGTIWILQETAANLQSFHDFDGSDGSQPRAPLLPDLSIGYGSFGTTLRGGDSDDGTVFHTFYSGGFQLTVLHSFDGLDGSLPYAGLMYGSDGFLYGTTASGGANGFGTVYRLDVSGNNFQVIHDFAAADGTNPASALIQRSDGFLYGTAFLGGANGYGTVYKLDTAGHAFVVLHDFNLADGAQPTSSLVEGSDGLLYGTASIGGANAHGVIYRLHKSGGFFVVLHDFTGADGGGPLFDGLVEDSEGNFYGTTYEGGANGGGVLFVMTPPVVPFIKLSPAVVLPNSPFRVRGRGYQAGERVRLSFDGSLVATATANGRGKFSERITVPRSALPGEHVVKARGVASGLSAEATLLVRAAAAEVFDADIPELSRLQ